MQLQQARIVPLYLWETQQMCSSCLEAGPYCLLLMTVL
jgi:hypothetical protein